MKREYAKRITLMEYFFSEKGTTEFAVWVAGFLLGVFAILVLLVGYFVPSFMESLRFPCWINSRSGLLCPGCGGTRAFYYFLRGKWVSSFFMHPVVPYMGVLYLVYMFRGAIHFLSKGKFSFMRFRLGYIYAAIGIILVQFVLKNMFLLGIL